MTTKHEHDCDCPHKPRAGGERTLAIIEVIVLLLLATFLVCSAATGRLRFFLAPGFVWLPPGAGMLLLAMSAARWLVVRAGGGVCECGEDHSGSMAMRWLYAIAIMVPLVFALAVNPRQFSSAGMQKRRDKVAIGRGIDAIGHHAREAEADGEPIRIDGVARASNGSRAKRQRVGFR